MLRRTIKEPWSGEVDDDGIVCFFLRNPIRKGFTLPLQLPKSSLMLLLPTIHLKPTTTTTNQIVTAVVVAITTNAIAIATLIAGFGAVFATSQAQAVEPTSLPRIAPPALSLQAAGGTKITTNFTTSKNRTAKNGRGGLAKNGPSKSKKAAAKARVVKRNTNPKKL